MPTVKISVRDGGEVTVNVRSFIKGEKGDVGDNIQDIILLNGNENYQLTSNYLQGKSFIIMINNPTPIPIVVTQQGPNNPVHVFPPNASRFSFIRVLFVLNQWIKI
jgi:hypothetical protein